MHAQSNAPDGNSIRPRQQEWLRPVRCSLPHKSVLLLTALFTTKCTSREPSRNSGLMAFSSHSSSVDGRLNTRMRAESPSSSSARFASQGAGLQSKACLTRFKRSSTPCHWAFEMPAASFSEDQVASQPKVGASQN